MAEWFCRSLIKVVSVQNCFVSQVYLNSEMKFDYELTTATSTGW